MSEYKEERQQKVKNAIFKALHVVCYVLSSLFVVLMVVVGCQSCDVSHKNEQASATNHVNNALQVKQSLQPKRASYNEIDITGFYTYILKDEFLAENNISISVSEQLSFLDDTRSANFLSEVHHEAQPEVRYYLDIEGYFLSYHDRYFNRVRLSYQTYSSAAAPDDFYYRLAYIAFMFDGTNPWVSLHKIVDYPDNNKYGVYDGAGTFSKIFVSPTDRQYHILDYMYTKYSQSTFIFNKVFNYNAPANQPIGNNLWYESGLTDFEVDHYSDLYLGYFVSNGMLFDTIRYVYWNSDGHLFKNGSDQFYGADNYAFYKEMRYYNSSTGDSVIVNYRNRYWEDGGSLPQTYFTAETTWVNDGYREITLLYELSDLQRIHLESFNNNNQTSISGNVVNGDMSNVFTLVGSAFTGLLPILNTMLLPGITIGMLMFVPLVAMLVFAIIRIIKK